MKDSTHEFLLSLRQLSWFHSMGSAPLSENAIFLSSRESAFQSFLSEDWQTFKLMLKNRSARTLSAVDYSQFKNWNIIAKYVRSEFQTSIAHNVNKAITEYKIPADAIAGISWDVLNSALEIEFSAQLEIRFHHETLWAWYAKGYLPCGWQGTPIDEHWAGASNTPIPQGLVVVY